MTTTHPHHPLRGQRVEIVRIRSGADPDLVIRKPDGRCIVVAMSCTDYAALPEPDRSHVSPHLLDFDGLCRVAHLIDRMRCDGRVPQADEGESG